MRYPFKPDIGTSRFRVGKLDDDGEDVVESQRAFDDRLMHHQLEKNKPKSPTSPRDKVTGQKLYEPLIQSRGPLSTPCHVRHTSPHSGLHKHQSTVVSRREDLCRTADLYARRDAGASHVSDKSRLMLESMRYEAYAHIWRELTGHQKHAGGGRTKSDDDRSASDGGLDDDEASSDGDAEARPPSVGGSRLSGSVDMAYPYESHSDRGSDELAADVVAAATSATTASLRQTLDPVQAHLDLRSCRPELAVEAVEVVKRATGLLDFETFCLEMEHRVSAAPGAPKSRLFARPAASVRRDLDEERRARDADDDAELTFTPHLHKSSAAKLDPERRSVVSVEDHLLSYTEKYAKQRKDREARRRNEESVKCTFRPKLTKKAQEFTVYPLSRKFGTCGNAELARAEVQKKYADVDPDALHHAARA